MAERVETGRPPLATPELVASLVACIADGNFRETAAALVGISPRTLSRWMAKGKKDPDGPYGHVYSAIVRAEGTAEGGAVKRICDAGDAEGGSVDHLKWWLERKFPERWGRDRGEITRLKKRLADLEKLIAESASPKSTSAARHIPEPLPEATNL
jgi:hypothetical protein